MVSALRIGISKKVSVGQRRDLTPSTEASMDHMLSPRPGLDLQHCLVLRQRCGPFYSSMDWTLATSYPQKEDHDPRWLFVAEGKPRKQLSEICEHQLSASGP